MSATKRLDNSFSTKLLIDMRVILHEVLHHLAERLIVRHARRVGRVLFGILVGNVGCHLRRDIVANAFRQAPDLMAGVAQKSTSSFQTTHPPARSP